MTCTMKVCFPPNLAKRSIAFERTRTLTRSSTGEGHFDDGSNKPSGAATPVDVQDLPPPGKKKGISKKAKTAKQRLAIADGSGL